MLAGVGERSIGLGEERKNGTGHSEFLALPPRTF